jgi:hypothetical protein
LLAKKILYWHKTLNIPCRLGAVVVNVCAIPSIFDWTLNVQLDAIKRTVCITLKSVQFNHKQFLSRN